MSKYEAMALILTHDSDSSDSDLVERFIREFGLTFSEAFELVKTRGLYLTRTV